VPPDDGFGIPGDGTFNTPSLIEAADTGPFFHNNSIETIEGSVAFYNGDAFNNSPAGQPLQQATGSGINLDGTQVVEVAAFLRVINALENIRQSIELLEPVAQKWHQTVEQGKRLLDRAAAEAEDSIAVLSGGGLHPEAVKHLKEALRLTEKARCSWFSKSRYAREAIEQQGKARDQLVETS
jgi:hypothetical protein